MTSHYRWKIVIAVFGLLSMFGSAQAATALFKGTAVILARTNTPACTEEYDLYESYTVLYRANIGAGTANETLAAIGPTGGYLLINKDSTPTLKGNGTVRLIGHAYAQLVSIASTKLVLARSPATIAANTATVVASGALYNAGIAGCTVKFRAALTRLPPGGY